MNEYKCLMKNNRGVKNWQLVLGNQYNTTSTDTSARLQNTIRVIDKESVANVASTN